MSAYNHFGTTFSRILELYPETVAKDFGGEEVLIEELDRVSKRVAGALTPDVYKKMTEPELQLIVRRASDGQSTGQLGIFPIVAGSVRLWRIPLGAITDPRSISQPVPGYGELTGWSVTAATGAITGIPALSANDQVYASYQVDVASAAFAMESLGEFVALGTAFNVGPKLYAKGSDTFDLVKEYGERFNKQLELAMSGEWIPDELRLLRWWHEVERSSAGISSIDLPRG